MSPPLTVGSLFAGIGGFDLAAEWMGWRTVWHSEIDPYACAVFAKHFPHSRNVGDVTTWQPSPETDAVDLICGGFPCQDISTAGKGAGIDGPRSGLWREFARTLGLLRPRYVVVENVAALLGRGATRVLGDLAALGYDAEWEVVSAAAVGAPHLRERLWIVAYTNGDGAMGNGRNYPDRKQYSEAEIQERADINARTDFSTSNGSGTTPHTDGGRSVSPSVSVRRERQGKTTRLTHGGNATLPTPPYDGKERIERLWKDALSWFARFSRGENGRSLEKFRHRCHLPQPTVERVYDGVSQELGCLGNAIVPQVAYAWAFQQVAQLEAERLV